MTGSWRFHSPLHDLVLSHRRDVPPDRLAAAVSAFFVASALDGWMRDRSARRTVMAMCDRLFGISLSRPWGRTEDDHAKRMIETALRGGELVAVRVERRKVIVPLENVAEPLGPQDEPDAPDTWIAVEVYDSTGESLAKKVGFPRGDVVRPLRPTLPFGDLPRSPAWASAIGVGLPMLPTARTSMRPETG